MSQPVEFWTTVSTNLVVFVIGSILAVISYLAHRREQDRSFQIAALGFVFVTLGNLTILVFQTIVKRSYFLTGVELLRAQTMEGGLLLIGFLSLFYSLYRY